MKITGTNKKPKKNVRDVPLNFSIMNCRSLKHKLNSLAQSFIMNKSHFILTNETWFKPRDPQLEKYLLEMEDKYDMDCIRKDRKPGRTGLSHGGVAFFYDKSNSNFKKFQLNALKAPEKRDYEILACRGRLRGVKREVVAFSIYLPPDISSPFNQVFQVTRCLLAFIHR